MGVVYMEVKHDDIEVNAHIEEFTNFKYPKISDVIVALEAAKEKYGDIPVTNASDEFTDEINRLTISLIVTDHDRKLECSLGWDRGEIRHEIPEEAYKHE